MKYLPFRMFATVIAAALATWAATVLAQAPPHSPGAICFTPQFWCWASPPGKPGVACSCPSPYGRVAGTFG